MRWRARGSWGGGGGGGGGEGGVYTMVEWNEQIDPGEFNNVANNFPQLVLPLFSICNEAPNIIMQNFQTLLIYKTNLLAVN